MKIIEVIQRVQSLYSKGVQSDDSRLRPRHIYNKLLTTRAKLIEQKANKKQNISRWTYTVLPCVEVIEAPQTECPCLPDLGCKFYRSKYQIPAPIYSVFKPLIKPIMTLDGEDRFSYATWESAKYRKSNRYTSKTPSFYFRDNYLYFNLKIDPKVIIVTLIAEDPIEAETYKGYCDEIKDLCGNDISTDDCTPVYDFDFKLENSLIDTCVAMTAEELVNVFSQMREDKTNNNADSSIQEGK